MRGQNLSSKLLARSIELAQESGAEFYLVLVVNRFLMKSFQRRGFEIVKEVNFADYFRNESEILQRIQPEHPTARVAKSVFIFLRKFSKLTSIFG